MGLGGFENYRNVKLNCCNGYGTEFREYGMKGLV
jgi:hypothetical protein